MDGDILFKGPTRPTTIAGVTHTAFMLNAIVNVEAFIATSDFTFLFVIWPGIHGLCYLAILRDPFIFELLKLKILKTPPIKNRAFWRCNSYTP